MDPLTIGMMGGGALLGYLNHQAQVNKDKAAMTANAAQIQYSPWTGMKSQVQGPQANSMFGDMAQGAVGMGMMGHQMGQAGAPAAAQKLGGPTDPIEDALKAGGGTTWDGVGRYNRPVSFYG